MSSSNAIVWLDHQDAQFLHLQGDEYAPSQVKAHHHNTRQHASGVRTEHEFFGAVCHAIDAVNGTLVVGAHTALSDFKHYVGKHSPATEKHIVGWQASERLSEGQLAALGRKFFERHDGTAGHAEERVR